MSLTLLLQPSCHFPAIGLSVMQMLCTFARLTVTTPTYRTDLDGLVAHSISLSHYRTILVFFSLSAAAMASAYQQWDDRKLVAQVLD
ncbi:hypothetical protein [Chamaesiphon sp.]|uniref:hypothetical protein n=1 Tax=Chamaesiphon sp. TaxID=2814140 RepID=UPI0035940013